MNKIVSSEDPPNNEDTINLPSDVTAGDLEENTLEPAEEGECLAPVGDTAREQDKAMRLTILQKLLELACAMVTFCHLTVTLRVIFIASIDKEW